MAVTPAELVAAVKAHAIAHYTEEGWDFVVETMADEDILEVVGRCRSAETAIAAMRREVRPLHEHRAEQRAMADW